MGTSKSPEVTGGLATRAMDGGYSGIHL
jgi:hypothetical protein